MNQQRWDITFMKMAILMAERHSKDYTRVGALLAKESYPLSFGYNGIIRGYPDFDLKNREKKLVYTEHAERNALLNALRNHIDVRGATLYCTRFPCHECMKAIIQAGVKRIVYMEDKAYEEGHWSSSVGSSIDMALVCEVVLVPYSKEEIYASPLV